MSKGILKIVAAVFVCVFALPGEAGVGIFALKNRGCNCAKQTFFARRVTFGTYFTLLYIEAIMQRYNFE